MTGYMNSDGSELVGGQLPSGAGQGLALDSYGALKVAQMLSGAALSDINPEINISNIQQMILNGKAFSCCTGQQGGTANAAASFFVPSSSTKNVLIWSVRVMYSNTSQLNDFRWLTADDSNITAGTSVASNVLNMKAGGPAPASGFAMHWALGVTAPAISASTLPLDETLNPANSSAELLSAGMFLLIPAGTAAGIAIYTAITTTGKWTVTVRWVEF